MPTSEPSRRDVIRGAVGGLIAATLPVPASRAADQKDDLPELIVRGGLPLNAETPVELLDSYLTPVNRFFVRSHFGTPRTDAMQGLSISGLVKTPGQWEHVDWKRLDHVTLVAVLQCSGNGRAMFAPKVPGVGWERGAVANAEWTGCRLKDFLEQAGLEKGARHVHFLGADKPPHPKTPAFHRSLPIERAMDPSTLPGLQHQQPADPDLPRWPGPPDRAGLVGQPLDEVAEVDRRLGRRGAPASSGGPATRCRSSPPPGRDRQARGPGPGHGPEREIPSSSAHRWATASRRMSCGFKALRGRAKGG